MVRRRHRRWVESRLFELLPLLGLTAGLLVPRGPVHGGGLVAVVQAYVMHALVGAAAGAVLAALLVLAWRLNRSVPGPASGRHSIPERVRHEVWRRDRARCVDCGSRARLEFDHIIPLSRGGSSTARNLELRCEPCNRRKGARI